MILEAVRVVMMVVFFVALIWHTRKSLFVLVMLLLATPLIAQNCDSVVSDDARLLGSKLAAVSDAANGLIKQGADVRVRTFVSSGGNLDLAVDRLRVACPSWSNTKGNDFKSTLIVLAVSRDRKAGMYMGSNWHKALDAHWNRIKKDYMLQHFKEEDYAGGFIATEEQLAKRIAAAQDEAIKPVVNQQQTINQPSDYSGLWSVLWGLILFGAFIWAVWMALYLMAKRKKERETLRNAQSSAVAERNQATSGLNTMGDKIASKKAAGETVPLMAESLYNSASEDFGHLNTSFHSDPDDAHLSLAEYNTILSQYRAINRKLTDAGYALLKNAPPVSEHKHVVYTHGHKEKVQPAQPAPSPQPVAPIVTHESNTNVVVVNNTPAPTYEYTPPPTRNYFEEPFHPSTREEESSSFGGSSSFSSSSRDDDSSSSSSGGSSSWSDSSSSSSDSGSSDGGSFGGSSDF